MQVHSRPQINLCTSIALGQEFWCRYERDYRT